MSDRLVSGSLRDTFVRDARRVPVPAGALLVWNSRLIHQGHAGGPRLAMVGCACFLLVSAAPALMAGWLAARVLGATESAGCSHAEAEDPPVCNGARHHTLGVAGRKA
eukprot:TRINITY_DN7865_c0_g1_i2.p4 TRINITY_DN7865_c0_g1~~TRINITY_DN7865_c0_g1_i2.p4  ORF type:complete len:108 (-),score=23.88 TRINITY_DN7865_c0_g1_i2:225-548(-)